MKRKDGLTINKTSKGVYQVYSRHGIEVRLAKSEEPKGDRIWWLTWGNGLMAKGFKLKSHALNYVLAFL